MFEKLEIKKIKHRLTVGTFEIEQTLCDITQIREINERCLRSQDGVEEEYLGITIININEHSKIQVCIK